MHHDDPNDFGELRSLLHRPASRAGWARLCTLVESRAPHMLEGVVTYVDELLSTWPSHYRIAPPHWVLRACSARGDEGFLPWHLVRALELDEHLLSSLDIARVLDRLTHISHLAIDGQRPRAISLVSALRTQAIHVEALHVRHWSASPTRLARQLAATSMPRLHTLHISDSRQDHDAIDALLDAPWLPRIERLELPHNLLQDLSIIRLLDHMPDLTHLDLSSNRLSIQGMRTLLHMRRSPPLHTLILNHNGSHPDAQTNSLFCTPVKGLRAVDVERSRANLVKEER